MNGLIDVPGDLTGEFNLIGILIWEDVGCLYKSADPNLQP